jgi:hypothetical protein
MQLTKKHKVYGAVMGLCAIALLVDQLVPGPARATAETSAASASDLVVPAEARGAGRAGATEQPPLWSRSVIADRLETVAGEHRVAVADVTDAFRPSALWMPETPMVVHGDENEAAYRFRTGHRLTAVMNTADGGCAIVDGKGLFIGHQVDGFTLVSVGDRSAVFEGDGFRVEMTVDEGG